MHAMGTGTGLPLPPWSHFSSPWQRPQTLPGLVPKSRSSLHAPLSPLIGGTRGRTGLIPKDQQN